MARTPMLFLVVGCTSTASLGEFSREVDLHVTTMTAEIALAAPSGCPELDHATSVMLNGNEPDPAHITWGGPDCQAHFSFTPNGSDATLALAGGGSRIDALVPHAFDARNAVGSTSTVYASRGAGVYVPYNGVAGDMPAVQAQLVNHSNGDLVRNLDAKMSGPDMILVAIPNDAPLGFFRIHVQVNVPLPVTDCTGATTCAADWSGGANEELSIFN